MDINEDIEAGETGERDERGRLLPGHAKLGGRMPGVRNWNARRVAESLNCSPLIVALTILKTGFFPLAKGEKPEDQRRASPELFTKILLETLAYCAPKLSALQLTGANDGPVAVASLDVTTLMADSELARAAQKLALAMAAQQPQIAPRFPDSFDVSPGDFRR